MITRLRHHLTKARERMKYQTDLGRSERKFQIGDWVWLKLQPYRQSSVQHRSNTKLGPKYFRRFQIMDRVEKGAYNLQLPTSAQIHSTVYVTQLKAFRCQLPTLPYIPHSLQGTDAEATPNPCKILAKMIAKSYDRAVVQYLIQWRGILRNKLLGSLMMILELSIHNSSLQDKADVKVEGLI